MLALLMLMQAAAAQPLDRSCFGGGTANKVTMTNIDASGSNYSQVGGMPYSSYGSGSATVMGQRHQGFADQVDIRLFNGDDRIRLPRTLLPPLHGGKGGWFKLKNVVSDARSIHASAAVNFMNNPKVFIDRATGTISILGKAGDFAGQCEAFKGDAPAKF